VLESRCCAQSISPQAMPWKLPPQFLLPRQGGGDVNELETARWGCIDSALQISEAANAPAADQVLAKLLPSLLDAIQSSHESSLQPLLRCIR